MHMLVIIVYSEAISRSFALQGGHTAPIGMKFGMEELTQCRGVGVEPQKLNTISEYKCLALFLWNFQDCEQFQLLKFRDVQEF